ncbi:MAG: winged helix DNA-binding protein [Thermoleophilia bacterium]
MSSRPHDVLHVGHLFRIPFQSVSGEILAGLAAAGFGDVRPAHLVVFQHVRREGSRLVELARLAQITPQAMGYLVDQLAERGYVERIPDPDDRRAVLVRLTGRGWDEVACALATIADLEREWEEVLGAAAYAQLKDSLGALCAHLATRGYV